MGTNLANFSYFVIFAIFSTVNYGINIISSDIVNNNARKNTKFSG